MTLEQIRQVQTLIELKPAIKVLCDKMQSMSWDEFNAYKRTLEDQATKLGISLKTINATAENYQVFGQLEENI